MALSFRLCAVVIGMVALLVLATHYTYGQSEVVTTPPSITTKPQWHVRASTTAPAVSASYAVFDVADGAVLLTHNSDQVRPIASLTKLLTAATVWQDFTDAATVVEVTLADTRLPGVMGAVQVGEHYTPYELLFPLLLTSSNHAAATLERAQPSLVNDMNTITSQLGLRRSAVADASGLSDNNQASADDLQRLTLHLYHTAPHIFDITRLERYVGAHSAWRNNSPFVQDAAYRGGKHGYTPAAGRTAVVLFAESFAGGDRVLGYIVLGANDSAEAVAKLRTHVKQTLDWQ